MYSGLFPLTDLNFLITRSTAESDARVKEAEERRKAIIEAVDEFTSHVDYTPEYAINDRIEVMMGNVSKPCNIGEVIVGSNESTRCIVSAITEVSNEEFDAAVRDLYNDFNYNWLLLKSDYKGSINLDSTSGYVGGTFSNDPLLKDVSMHDMFHDPSLTGIWYETCCTLVTVIKSKNRRPLFVDTSGYGYARYVGFKK